MLAGVKEGSDESIAPRLASESVYEYVGGLKDSRAHGTGVYTWANGTTFEGEFVDGKVSSKH